MSIRIEVAKRKSRVDEKAIEDVVWLLLQDRKVHKNSIILIPSAKCEELNTFKDQLHSIAFNDIPVS